MRPELKNKQVADNLQLLSGLLKESAAATIEKILIKVMNNEDALIDLGLDKDKAEKFMLIQDEIVETEVEAETKTPRKTKETTSKKTKDKPAAKPKSAAKPVKRDEKDDIAKMFAEVTK